MALPAGQISMSQVNTELGLSSTAQISLNDAAVRTLASVPSGAISMANLQGKSSGFSLTVSGNTTNYNVRSAAISAGWPGSTDTAVTVSINPGVTISSPSTGSSAFNVGSPWPASSTILITNNGTIIGAGGPGGSGGNTTPGGASPGSPGSAGGPAFVTSRPITLNNTGSIISGGGGGGGGGGGVSQLKQGPLRGGGGGGGGGRGGSTGGSGGSGGTTAAQAGGNGSIASAGGGGSGGTHPPTVAGPGGAGGAGGSGGSSGAPAPNAAIPGGGGSGGATGACIQGNPFIAYQSTGTRTGPIS